MSQLAEISPSQTESTTRLQLSNLSKSFSSQGKQLNALSNINLEVNDAEFISLVGPSGCGKSTLLNIIAGLEAPTSGSIMEDGEPLSAPGQNRMMMFQESALFPWLDVFGNVMFGLKLRRELSKSEREDRAHSFIAMVGLERFTHSNIHELSGGMKQRVALARALAPNPRLLLMDEPFAALDAMTREQLYADIQEICLRQKKTTILVTHNIREAVCLGDRVLLISGSPGMIRSEFKISLPRPRDISSVEVARIATEITKALKSSDIKTGTKEPR